MNLPNTTDKIEAVTSNATATIDSVVFYDELDTSTKDWSATDAKIVTITGVSAGTDVSGSPAAGKVRQVSGGTWRNTHASLAQDVLVRFNRNGTIGEMHKVTLQPGECLEWNANINYFQLAAASTGFGDVLERRLDSAGTGQNISTVQPWFPTTGSVNVEAGVVYDFEGLLSLTRAAGVTSHTTSISFGGTATLTSILWISDTNTGDVLTNVAQNTASGKSAAAVVVKAASTSATEEIMCQVKGSVKINAAGTLIPQFTYSAAPGGAPTVNLGSFFSMIKKGTGFNTKGIWS